MNRIGIVLLAATCAGCFRMDGLGNPAPSSPPSPSTDPSPLPSPLPSPSPLDPMSLPPTEQCGGHAVTAAPACEGTACVLAVDEAVPVALGLNDGPQIVWDHDAPLVYLPRGADDNPGQVARRVGGSWVLSQASLGLLGAVAVGPTRTALLDSDGEGHVDYTIEDADRWKGTPIEGQMSAGPASLAVDDQGCAYAALTSGSDGSLRLGREAEDWAFAAPFGTITFAKPNIALRPDGSPEIVGWRAAGLWELAWVHPPDAPSVVQTTLDGRLDTSILVRMGVSQTSTHLLWQRDVDVFYAARNGSFWNTSTLVIGRPEYRCDATPTVPEQLCTGQRTAVEPIAVLVDRTDGVRLVWSVSDVTQAYGASCFGLQQSCVWAPAGAATRATSIFVSSPAGVKSAPPIVLGHGLTDATAAIADDGSIHIVGYDDAGARYLVLTP